MSLTETTMRHLFSFLVYIPFNNEQEDITLGFFLSDAANKDWKLKISRIACNSQELGI